MADNCLPTDVNGGKSVAKRRVKRPEPQAENPPSRLEEIADYVHTMLDDMLNESMYWNVGQGEPAPTWFELRDAIMAKVFAVEHEMGRQDLHSEQVRENCL